MLVFRLRQTNDDYAEVTVTQPVTFQLYFCGERKIGGAIGIEAPRDSVKVVRNLAK